MNRVLFVRYKHDDTPDTPSEALNGADALITREKAYELGLPRQITLIAKSSRDRVSWAAAENQCTSFADRFKG
jgi:hypothetical protein